MIERDVTLLTSNELCNELSECNGVIIPLASVEQCGFHGAVGIDVHVAAYVSERLAPLCDMLFAPVIPYGDTLEMDGFKGTVNVPDDILSGLYYSVADSFFKSGAANVLFFASHSLNTRAADRAARRLYSEGKNAVIADFWKACSQVSGDILEDDVFGTGHGSEQISSVSLAIKEELIKKNLAVNEMPQKDFKKKVRHLYGGADPVVSYANFHDYSQSGSWGDITSASAMKGMKIIERALNKISDSVLEVIR